MWNGALDPRLVKHRDYRHKTFFEHVMDSGGQYTIDPDPVMAKYRPLDARLHSTSDRYYFVDFTLGHGDETVYEFLIHAEPDLSEPNENRIKNEFNDVMADPVIGGRDWWDYLDFDSEETLSNPRVAARLANGEAVPMGPPRQRRRSDYENEEQAWLDNL